MTKPVSPQTIEMYMDRAGKLRAEAIRASFAEFGQAIKNEQSSDYPADRTTLRAPL